MHESQPLFWVAVVIGLAAVIPIIAATLLVAAIIWMPIAIALVVTAVAVYWRARHEMV
jgi:hypothetical protein